MPQFSPSYPPRTFGSTLICTPCTATTSAFVISLVCRKIILRWNAPRVTTAQEQVLDCHLLFMKYRSYNKSFHAHLSLSQLLFHTQSWLWSIVNIRSRLHLFHNGSLFFFCLPLDLTMLRCIYFLFLSWHFFFRQAWKWSCSCCCWSSKASFVCIL